MELYLSCVTALAQQFQMLLFLFVDLAWYVCVDAPFANSHCF
jgi:hypothetical protein